MKESVLGYALVCLSTLMHALTHTNASISVCKLMHTLMLALVCVQNTMPTLTQALVCAKLLHTLMLALVCAIDETLALILTI